MALLLKTFTGEVRDRWEGRPPSAILKTEVTGPLQATRLGLAGDSQADLKVHGGPDKAIHLYPSEHYAHWRDSGHVAADRLVPGSFGENLASEGLLETDYCVGDLLQIGAARCRITQGRQPCWKINEHTRSKRTAMEMQKLLLTGLYLAVETEGPIEAGQTIELVERPNPDWTVAQVTRARFDGKTPIEEVADIARLPGLAANWRAAFEKRLGGDFHEDTSKRLEG